MIKILINEAIGRRWGICEADIAEQLKDAQAGEEIEISINSPGGEVYEGISIFNNIREAAKSHKVTVKITGLAASMASYIALAARTVNKDSKIIVFANSVFLIHNPLNIIAGDYREMAKAADFLERLAAMFASTYSFISGKNDKETRDLMDAETYFIGQEIIDNGYSNNFDQINRDEDDKNNAYDFDRNSLIINAKLQVEKTIEQMRKTAKEDLEKAAALIVKSVYNPQPNAESPALGSGSLSNPAPAGTGRGVRFENSVEGEIMTKEELKQKHPELYAAIFEEGKGAGADEERKRVEAHLKLGETSGSMKIAAQFIRDGKSVASEEVQAEYLSARMNNSALNSRNADNPPNVNPAGGEEADAAAMEAAWKMGISGRNEKGEKV